MTDLTAKAMLAASIRCGIFAKRDTIEQALNHATATIEQLDSVDRAAVYTAFYVALNTVADKIMELPDSSAADLEPSAAAQLPEPPAEVLVNSDGLQVADYPATGNQLLNEKIADIVEQIVGTQLKAVEYKIRAVDDRLENWFGNNLDIIDERITEVVRNMSFTIDVD